QQGGLGRDVTLRSALDAAEAGIAKSLADQPAAEASIRDTLGQTYHYLGEPRQAILQLERAVALRRQVLGPDHPETLGSMNHLAGAYQAAGRLADALPLLEQTLERFKATLGPDHPETLQAMNDLARAYQAAGRLAEAIALLEETLKRRQSRLGSDHPDSL